MAGFVQTKLKQLLKEKKVTRYWLAQHSGIQYQTLDRYYKNKVTRYDGYLIAAICDCLDCEIGDILEYVKDSDVKQEKSK